MGEAPVSFLRKQESRKNNWIPTFVGMTPRLLHSAKIFPLFHFLFQMDYGWGIYGRGKICFIPTG